MSASEYVTAGVTGEDEKWRYCVEDAGGSVSFAVGAMYVHKTFHGDSKASVSSISCHSLHMPCLFSCLSWFRFPGKKLPW